jgi:uncharacterized membrane protein YsdA (DUF1294 family)
MNSKNPYTYPALLTTALTIGTFLTLYYFLHVAALNSYCIAINTSAFLSMGLDKNLSRSPTIRSPEALLFLVALVGGSPGILLGCHLFKHKTKKASFQFVLLLIFAVQLYLLQSFGVQFRH